MKAIKRFLLSAILVVCGSALPAGAQTEAGKGVADVPLVQLNNGVVMPRFGLGTFLQGSDEMCRQSCLTALKAGYRHIDTAHAYDDERGVGQAVKESGVPRNEIWITSKLWPSEYGEGKTAGAIDKMLKRLDTNYIDLLYVHQPVGDFVGAWRDMERAVEAGKVRALGISNFDANDSVFNLIMQEAHGKSPAQVILRWHIQEDFSVIPGATNPDYINENIQIFDFELTNDEMQSIRSLNKEQRFFNVTYEQVEQFGRAPMKD